jgi:hypothetical protein
MICPLKTSKFTTDENVSGTSGGGSVFEGWTDMKQMRVLKFLGGKCQDIMPMEGGQNL